MSKISKDLKSRVHTEVLGKVDELLPEAVTAAIGSQLKSSITIKIGVTPKMDDKKQRLTLKVEGAGKLPALTTEHIVVMRGGQLELDLGDTSTGSSIEEEPEPQVAVV